MFRVEINLTYISVIALPSLVNVDKRGTVAVTRTVIRRFSKSGNGA
jgi:hypothetical protein